MEEGRHPFLTASKKKKKREREKAATMKGPCFMVLLTLKEQVEWNMHHTGQLCLCCYSSRDGEQFMPQAFSWFGETDSGDKVVCLSDGPRD